MCTPPSPRRFEALFQTNVSGKVCVCAFAGQRQSEGCHGNTSSKVNNISSSKSRGSDRFSPVLSVDVNFDLDAEKLSLNTFFYLLKTKL